MHVNTVVNKIIINTKAEPKLVRNPQEGVVHYLVSPFEKTLKRKDHDLFIRRTSRPEDFIYPQQYSEEVVTKHNVTIYAYTKETLPTVALTSKAMHLLLLELKSISKEARWEITMFPDATVLATEIS